eukprot:Hpha_TRINITY_DN7851_c0_g1::TRINITY_DN7851_c0_g1_i1::g.185634::m.185634
MPIGLVRRRADLVRSVEGWAKEGSLNARIAKLRNEGKSLRSVENVAAVLHQAAVHDIRLSRPVSLFVYSELQTLLSSNPLRGADLALIVLGLVSSPTQRSAVDLLLTLRDAVVCRPPALLT